MALFQVSGPPEEVERLRYLSENLDVIKHVANKMRQQRLSPSEQVIVLVQLSVANELGIKFMRQCVDPEFSKMSAGESYGCNVKRDELKNFLEPNAPLSLSICDDDVPEGMHRMVVIANNGVTKMDAAFTARS